MVKKILFIVGTRPEAIKLAPVIRLAAADPRFEAIVCSTGQHQEMLRSVFCLFGVRPDVDFGLMRPGQSLAEVTCQVLEKLTAFVRASRPSWIVVQGDTTTALAGSLCAFYEKTPLAHVEAGLRTGNMHSPFPEEFNRRVTALIARLHFAPTELAKSHLVQEGVPPDRVFVSGNTSIDALLLANEMLRERPAMESECRARFSFLNPKKKLLLATVHRRESLGEPMREIASGLRAVANRGDVEVLMPLHPNPKVREAVRHELGDRAVFACAGSPRKKGRIWLVEPQEYLSFVYLMRASSFIVSDSGGIQEEAPGLGKPVLVARDNTERPEAILAGTSRLVGTSAERISSEAKKLLDWPAEHARMARAHNPYGDGTASASILDALSCHAEGVA